MNLQTKKILGVSIIIDSKSKILEEIRKYLGKPTTHNPQPTTKKVNPFIIFTPNPEIINFAQKDKDFMRIVNTAQINLPDGAGVVWAMRKIYGERVGKIPGTDFMLDLANFAQKQGLTIGLIGGKGKLADVTRECLQAQHPGLKIAVFDAPDVRIQSSEFRVQNNRDKIINSKPIHNSKFIILNSVGEQSKETEKYFENLVKELKDKNVDILFVALGHPKQELFIHNLEFRIQNSEVNKPLVLMSVGGAFDYISGRVPRAPLFIRNIGLEWLYRLILEPWRIVRQIRGSEFFLRIAFPSLFPIQ